MSPCIVLSLIYNWNVSVSLQLSPSKRPPSWIRFTTAGLRLNGIRQPRNINWLWSERGRKSEDGKEHGLDPVRYLPWAGSIHGACKRFWMLQGTEEVWMVIRVVFHLYCFQWWKRLAVLPYMLLKEWSPLIYSREWIAQIVFVDTKQDYSCLVVVFNPFYCGNDGLGYWWLACLLNQMASLTVGDFYRRGQYCQSIAN